MIKTLIVDDSPLARLFIKDFLESDGSFKIIGEAENGLDGVKQAGLLAPDLITMDIEMPVMDGLEAISEIKKIINTAIVVISIHNTAKMVYDATVRGAFEFFAKDLFASQTAGPQRDQILNTLKHITGIKERVPVRRAAGKQAPVTPRSINGVVIAASTGGPNALCQLCAALPKEFPVPIMLVQHNMEGFDLGFVQWLNGYTPLQVCLAKEQVVPVKGTIYVAPTGRHLAVGKTGFVFDDGEPIHNQKPAADVLFKSAAELYGNSLVSVVLTGMGGDGAEGTRYVKQANGITIAQDEASSMVYGMPCAAVETGCVDITLPLDGIAQRLISLTRESDKA